jgi:hypothetical protein
MLHHICTVICVVSMTMSPNPISVGCFVICLLISINHISKG